MSAEYVLRMDVLRSKREELTARRVALEKQLALREATAAEFGAVARQSATLKWKRARAAAVAAKARNDDFIRSLHDIQQQASETLHRHQRDLSATSALLEQEKKRYFQKVESLYPAWQEKLQKNRLQTLRALEEKKRAVEKRRFLAKKTFEKERSLDELIRQASRDIEVSESLEKFEASERELVRHQINTRSTARYDEMTRVEVPPVSVNHRSDAFLFSGDSARVSETHQQRSRTVDSPPKATAAPGAMHTAGEMKAITVERTLLSPDSIATVTRNLTPAPVSPLVELPVLGTYVSSNNEPREYHGTTLDRIPTTSPIKVPVGETVVRGIIVTPASTMTSVPSSSIGVRPDKEANSVIHVDQARRQNECVGDKTSTPVSLIDCTTEIAAITRAAPQTPVPSPVEVPVLKTYDSSISINETQEHYGAANPIPISISTPPIDMPVVEIAIHNTIAASTSTTTFAPTPSTEERSVEADNSTVQISASREQQTSVADEMSKPEHLLESPESSTVLRDNASPPALLPPDNRTAVDTVATETNLISSSSPSIEATIAEADSDTIPVNNPEEQHEEMADRLPSAPAALDEAPPPGTPTTEAILPAATTLGARMPESILPPASVIEVPISEATESTVCISEVTEYQEQKIGSISASSTRIEVSAIGTTNPSTTAEEKPAEERKLSVVEKLSLADKVKVLGALMTRVEEGATEGDQFSSSVAESSSNADAKRELIRMAVGGRKAQINFFGSDVCFELILDIARDVGAVLFPSRAFEGIMNEQKIKKVHQNSKDKELELWKLLSNHMKQMVTLKALSASAIAELFGGAFLHTDPANQRSQRKMHDLLASVCGVSTSSGSPKRESAAAFPSSASPNRGYQSGSSGASSPVAAIPSPRLQQQQQSPRFEPPSLLQTAFLQHQSPPKTKTFGIASTGFKKKSDSQDIFMSMASSPPSSLGYKSPASASGSASSRRFAKDDDDDEFDVDF